MTTTILRGDCRAILPTLADASVQCCVTSPPYYGLRDYGVDGQIGLEPTPDEYVAEMVAVFREVRRVLRDDGTLWLNIGDSYARERAKGGSGPGGKNRKAYGEAYGEAGGAGVPLGVKPKDLLGIPWMLAFALRADGWYLRSDIIWHKPNPMPESVRDRPTSAHEHVFLLSKGPLYYYDADVIAEAARDWSQGGPGVGIAETTHYGAGNGGNSGLARIAARYKAGDAPATRNARNVWTIATQPFSGAHFATMPPALAERCISAGTKPGDTVLDPFSGAGTTLLVADRLGRTAVGIELNPTYSDLAAARLVDDAPLLAQVV